MEAEGGMVLLLQSRRDENNSTLTLNWNHDYMYTVYLGCNPVV